MNSSIELKPLALLLLLTASLVLTACAGSRGEPLQYTDRDEIRDGPGLLTGEEGAFTLEFGGGASDDEAAGSSGSGADEVSYQEYKAFKEYQGSGQQESGARDDEALAREYEEFQKWRESQEYQEWKDGRDGAQ
jgi:hypothetical protein